MSCLEMKLREEQEEGWEELSPVKPLGLQSAHPWRTPGTIIRGANQNRNQESLLFPKGVNLLQVSQSPGHDASRSF